MDKSTDESAIMKNGIRKNQIDEVTGLFNMMYFMEDSYYLLKDAGNGNISFLYFDVENFKSYNRKYGFQEGNKFLRRIAGIQDTALILDRAKLACESVKGTYDKG